MEHHFNKQVAIDYDIESAVILHNFFWWIDHNRANNTNFHDGRYWTYNSNEAFVDVFPYMNKTKIYRTLKKLADDGIILKGNYNNTKFDRKTWYAFSDKGMEYMISVGYGEKSAIHNDSTDSSFCNKRKCQSETTIAYSNPNNKPNNNHRESKENSPSNFVDNENDTNEIRSVNTQSRLQDKERKSSAKKRESGAPTEQEVKQFFEENKFKSNYRKFFLYYQAKGWKDIVDWQAQAELWEMREGLPHLYKEMNEKIDKVKGILSEEKERERNKKEYEEYLKEIGEL